MKGFLVCVCVCVSWTEKRGFRHLGGTGLAVLEAEVQRGGPV